MLRFLPLALMLSLGVWAATRPTAVRADSSLMSSSPRLTKAQRDSVAAAKQAAKERKKAEKLAKQQSGKQAKARPPKHDLKGSATVHDVPGDVTGRLDSLAAEALRQNKAEHDTTKVAAPAPAADLGRDAEARA
jgi:hypothetical protein